MICRIEVENLSGFDVYSQKLIKPLRRVHCKKVEKSITGNAPKDFVRIYEYGDAWKSRPNSWNAYIAKVGHKWYPNESITEHFITRVGQCIGLNMAESQLRYADGQIRFCSKYFLRKNESLVHGAEIFMGYLEDKQFVEKIESEGMSKDFFTFQVVKEAVESQFSENSESILADFVRMLGFDALIGNHDRHYFNWGVIDHALGRRVPVFSPIYDTARALFWNYSETKIYNLLSNASHIDKHIARYIEPVPVPQQTDIQ